MSIGQLMQKNSGSLIKASMQASSLGPAAGTRPKISSFSYTAVPPAEPRQLKKHDLLTIIIREESSITSDGKTDLKKDSSLDASLDEFIKLSPANFAIMGGAQGATPPSIKTSLARDTKGEAKLDRADNFTTRLEAEVVDVKPNGTVIIQASKTIQHDEESQVFVLTGTCRGTDVTADNSVYSWQIANLNVATYTEGAVHDTTQRGFLPKMLDSINPF